MNRKFKIEELISVLNQFKQSNITFRNAEFQSFAKDKGFPHPLTLNQMMVKLGLTIATEKRGIYTWKSDEPIYIKKFELVLLECRAYAKAANDKWLEKKSEPITKQPKVIEQPNLKLVIQKEIIQTDSQQFAKVMNELLSEIRNAGYEIEVNQANLPMNDKIAILKMLGCRVYRRVLTFEEC